MPGFGFPAPASSGACSSGAGAAPAPPPPFDGAGIPVRILGPSGMLGTDGTPGGVAPGVSANGGVPGGAVTALPNWKRRERNPGFFGIGGPMNPGGSFPRPMRRPAPTAPFTRNGMA